MTRNSRWEIVSEGQGVVLRPLYRWNFTPRRGKPREGIAAVQKDQKPLSQFEGEGVLAADRGVGWGKRATRPSIVNATVEGASRRGSGSRTSSHSQDKRKKSFALSARLACPQEFCRTAEEMRALKREGTEGPPRAPNQHEGERSDVTNMRFCFRWVGHGNR